MVAFVKHNVFVQNLAQAFYNLNSDTCKLALTPNDPSTFDTYGTITGELSTANGYTAGGLSLSGQSATQSGGVLTFTATSPTLTATGTVGPFQYAFLYDNTAAGKNVIGHWNYGSALTLNNGDSVTFTISGSGILTIT